MHTVTLPSPAKLNWFLHITSQRPDGYHNLETSFEFLDWCDELTIALENQGGIQLENSIPSVANEDNLIYKAAKAFDQAVNQPTHAKISIQKKLPMGGGLGGGSSNAATVLCGLNLLTGKPFSFEKLLEIGQTLGADIPAFIYGHCTLASGTGNEFYPVISPEPYYLLVMPSIGISTTKAFASPHLKKNCSPLNLRALAETISTDQTLPELENVFLKVVCEEYPELSKLYQLLLTFGTPRLSGTGSTFYLSFDAFDDAKRVANQISNQYYTHISRGHTRSPLSKQLASLS